MSEGDFWRTWRRPLGIGEAMLVDLGVISPTSSSTASPEEKIRFWTSCYAMWPDEPTRTSSNEKLVKGK